MYCEMQNEKLMKFVYTRLEAQFRLNEIEVLFFVFTVPHGERERERTYEVRSRFRVTVWNGLKTKYAYFFYNFFCSKKTYRTSILCDDSQYLQFTLCY